MQDGMRDLSDTLHIEPTTTSEQHSSDSDGCHLEDSAGERSARLKAQVHKEEHRGHLEKDNGDGIRPRDDALEADSKPGTIGTTHDDPETPEQPGPTRDFGFLPIPQRLQRGRGHNHELTLVLNVVFGIGATFTVANLYYVHSILIALSDEFGVSYSQVVNIPTLIQAAYAAGLLFICPTGDLVRRRPLLLLLVGTSATLTLGIAFVKSVVPFQVLSFFIGLSSVTPQILLPLAGDLARPDRRASALSIVFAGLILGILFARVISGAVTQNAGVSDVYFLAFGLQVLVWLMVWATVPDVPAKNKHLGYLRILGTMAKFAVTEPVLVQSAIIGCCSSMIFATFWVSSTFLLGDVYGFNEMEIGLFGLIGVLGVCTAPLCGKLVDGLRPWFGVLLGITLNVCTQAVYTGAAGLHVAVVGIVIFLLDISQQMTQVSNSAAVFSLNSAARARLSAVYVFSIFVGQLVGTAVGTRVYLVGGFRDSGGFCLGLLGLMLSVLFIRGPAVPNEKWVGWQGGLSLKKPATPVEPSVKQDQPDLEKSAI